MQFQCPRMQSWAYMENLFNINLGKSDRYCCLRNEEKDEQIMVTIIVTMIIVHLEHLHKHPPSHSKKHKLCF